jgi:hypothetical protein
MDFNLSVFASKRLTFVNETEVREGMSLSSRLKSVFCLARAQIEAQCKPFTKKRAGQSG